ncbi:DUF2339 domain-containing protein [Knoellia subterranea]|uniref:DUF2339 domain-containing protein n=1 Tax=Knoellia subterranea KCTC 19937 TaxID=1385521 RepID=A0A0A0JM04_9MICO|nr:DUF2339 domain-containing protein [Knoellia subterranea]KGN36671.1 hypothetical protein N803_04060 [Knoellia subterranea KCTC 19937]
MNTQLQDVRRLEAEFADAMNRMYAVGNGLARMRASLEMEQGSPAPAPTPAVASDVPAAPVAPVASGAPAAPVAAMTPVPAASATPLPRVEPVPSWWQREGAVTKVLALAGAVVTLIGIALLLALAMQQGWFVPELRVTLGVLLAVGLVIAGHVVRSRETSRGRSSAAPVAIAATGYAAGYLDVVAVTTVYGWVPRTAGLTIGAVVAVSGLLLARRWDRQLLAALTVLGATFLAPVVAEGFGDAVSLFVVVLSAAALLAKGDRGWPMLALARTVPAAGSIFLGIVFSAGDGSPSKVAIIAAGTLTLLALVGAVSAGRFDSHDLVGSATVAGSAITLLIAFGAHGETLRTTGFGLVAAAFAVALAITSRPPVGPVPTPLAATTGGVSGVAALLAVMSGAPERWVVTGILITALGYAAAAVTTRSRVTLWVATGTAVVASIAYLGHPTAYFSIGSAEQHDAVTALLDSLLAGGVAALGAWGVDVVRGIPARLRRSTRIAALIAGLTTSAVGVVSLGLIFGERLGYTQTGFVAGHALATVLWMLTSAWLLLRGLKAQAHRDLALRLGLGLAAVSVVKLFLFDLATLDGVWRVAAFIVTGLLLLASGTAYAKALERTRPPTAAA